MDTQALRQAAERLAGSHQQRESRTAPKESGERLATIERGDSEQIRVNWDSYNGRPYLSIKTWRLKHGQWWPDRSWTTIRLHELGTFVAGVVAAIDKADEHSETGGGHHG